MLAQSKDKQCTAWCAIDKFTTLEDSQGYLTGDIQLIQVNQDQVATIEITGMYPDEKYLVMRVKALGACGEIHAEKATAESCGQESSCTDGVILDVNTSRLKLRDEGSYFLVSVGDGVYDGSLMYRVCPC